MAHSNKKKMPLSNEYSTNPQLLANEDLQELKSEFFEAYQKNDLKLLSNGIFIFWIIMPKIFKTIISKNFKF